MREWTNSFLHFVIHVLRYRASLLKLLTNGLLSRNISLLLQYTWETSCERKNGAGQFIVPPGSFAYHLKVKSRNRMGLSPIHYAAKPQSIHKSITDLSYTCMCHKDPEHACAYLLYSEIHKWHICWCGFVWVNEMPQTWKNGSSQKPFW
jgi:hypothetical protein